jgi:CRP/FNR family transcriptional regulator, cyclic AMP receptor protein
VGARELIDGVPWLHTLSESARHDLGDRAHWFEWPAGTVVCRQDEEDRTCFVLAEGVMRASRSLPDGRSVTLAHLHPPAAFGEMALLRAGRRSATVTAIEPSRGIALDAEDVLAALRADADAALAVALDLARRLVAADERLLRYTLGTAAGGVSATLLAWAQARRDGGRTNGTGDVEVIGGVGDVARTAGIPKRAALRFMCHLELEGTITMRGDRTVIHDRDALARYLG